MNNMEKSNKKRARKRKQHFFVSFPLFLTHFFVAVAVDAVVVVVVFSSLFPIV